MELNGLVIFVCRIVPDSQVFTVWQVKDAKIIAVRVLTHFSFILATRSTLKNS